MLFLALWMVYMLTPIINGPVVLVIIIMIRWFKHFTICFQSRNKCWGSCDIIDIFAVPVDASSYENKHFNQYVLYACTDATLSA